MNREQLIEAIGQAENAERVFYLHDRLVRGAVANGREDFLAIEKMLTERLYGGQVDASKVVPAAGFLAYA